MHFSIRALGSQLLFSVASVISLGAVTKHGTLSDVGVAAFFIASNAILNSGMRGFLGSALVVYRPDHLLGAADFKYLRRLSFLGASVIVIVCLVLWLASVFPQERGLSLALLGSWQVAALWADCARSLNVFAPRHVPLHFLVLVGQVMGAAAVSGWSKSDSMSLILLALLNVATALAFVLTSKSGEASPVSVRLRWSMTREGLVQATALGGAMMTMSLAQPALAGAWQVVNQAFASPGGYLGGAAVMAHARRRIRGMAGAWDASMIAVGLVGCSSCLWLAGQLDPVQDTMRVLVGAEIWAGARVLLLPVLAYILYFQLVQLIVVHLRTGAVARVDSWVLCLNLPGAASLVVVTLFAPDQLLFLALLPILALAVAFIVTSPPKAAQRVPAYGPRSPRAGDS